MKENLKILLEQSRTADDALRKQLDLLKTPSCDDIQTSAIFSHLHDVWSRLITQGLDMRLFLKEVEKDLAVLGENESAGDLQSDLRLAERNALSELRFVASVQAMMQKALEKMILLLTASAKITSGKRRVVFNRLSKIEFAIDARKRAFDEEHSEDATAWRPHSSILPNYFDRYRSSEPHHLRKSQFANPLTGPRTQKIQLLLH